MTDIGKLAELVRVPTKYWAGLLIVSGLLLILPKQILARMRLDGVVEQWGLFVGVVFLVSAAFTTVGGASRLFEAAQVRRQSRRSHRQISNRLTRLDPQERAVLREFYLENANTIRVLIEDAAVSRLIRDGVLHVVGPREGLVFGTIVPVALVQQALNAVTPGLIGLPEELDQKTISPILSTRPKWVDQIRQYDALKQGLFR